MSGAPGTMQETNQACNPISYLQKIGSVASGCSATLPLFFTSTRANVLSGPHHCCSYKFISGYIRLRSKLWLNVSTQTHTSLGCILLDTLQDLRRQTYGDCSLAIVLGNLAKDFLVFIAIEIFLGPFPRLIPGKRDDLAAATTRVRTLGDCIFGAGSSAAKQKEFSVTLSIEFFANVVEVASVPCIALVAKKFRFLRVIAFSVDDFFHTYVPFLTCIVICYWHSYYMRCVDSLF